MNSQDVSLLKVHHDYHIPLFVVKSVRVIALINLNIQNILDKRNKTRYWLVKEMESNYEGYAQGVRAVMHSKPAGVIGVVTELMRTDAGFETAIETALGPGAQNIVTEDETAAKETIEYLKENKAGRLTFLPVKTLRANAFEADRELEKMQGFAGYATDRVSYDAKYKEVFLYLLGRTVIAETLDDAVLMSAGNKTGWRIVTKDGEIISPAGALTGGA